MEQQREEDRECQPDMKDANRLRQVKEMLVRLRKYRGSLPVGFKFDREEANERR